MFHYCNVFLPHAMMPAACVASAAMRPSSAAAGHVEPRLPDPNLTYDDLRRIVELIKSSDRFTEFRLKVGEIEIELRRRGDGAGSPAPDAAPGGVEAAPSPLPSLPPTSAHAAAHEPQAWPEGSTAIRSPMVGTFYRAPVPGAAPFVEVGQRVEPDTTVCIIEVMKLMNSIPAGTRGIVARVLVDDAAMVETSQPLILVRPE
jgi:acetyl-CoA carboxylase biotin carboxyl carrier protein